MLQFSQSKYVIVFAGIFLVWFMIDFKEIKACFRSFYSEIEIVAADMMILIQIWIFV